MYPAAASARLVLVLAGIGAAGVALVALALVGAWPLLAAWGLAGVGAEYALYLRLRIFIGKRPGGVDTWYYLASAEALRQQKRLPITLSQYLLHDPYESYPAVFPLFLALLPQAFLRNNFWLISPIIDCIHLLALYLLSFRLTDSVFAAGLAGLIYAVTPQLISETRNLNGRAFASLLLTVCMIVLLRSVIPSSSARTTRSAFPAATTSSSARSTARTGACARRRPLARANTAS